MKAFGRLCTLALALALAPRPASAVSIALAPASLTPSGTSFTVDLIISGLGAGSAPSLGAFDVGIAFDPSFLGFSGATYGSQLGAVPADAITGTTSAAGLVRLAEISLLTPVELDTLQPAAFALATLSFDVLPGPISSGTLSFDGPILSDALGGSLAIESASGASVRIVPAVPEPSGFLVFATGAAIASRRARRGAR